MGKILQRIYKPFKNIHKIRHSNEKQGTDTFKILGQKSLINAWKWLRDNLRVKKKSMANKWHVTVRAFKEWLAKVTVFHFT